MVRRSTCRWERTGSRARRIRFQSVWMVLRLRAAAASISYSPCRQGVVGTAGTGRLANSRTRSRRRPTQRLCLASFDGRHFVKEPFAVSVRSKRDATVLSRPDRKAVFHNVRRQTIEPTAARVEQIDVEIPHIVALHHRNSRAIRRRRGSTAIVRVSEPRHFLAPSIDPDKLPPPRAKGSHSKRDCTFRGSGESGEASVCDCANDACGHLKGPLRRRRQPLCIELDGPDGPLTDEQQMAGGVFRGRVRIEQPLRRSSIERSNVNAARFSVAIHVIQKVLTIR